MIRRARPVLLSLLFLVDAKALAKGLLLVAVVALAILVEDQPAVAQILGCSADSLDCATQPAWTTSSSLSLHATTL
jgi:hypothetical protein